MVPFSVRQNLADISTADGCRMIRPGAQLEPDHAVVRKAQDQNPPVAQQRAQKGHVARLRAVRLDPAFDHPASPAHVQAGRRIRHQTSAMGTQRLPKSPRLICYLVADRTAHVARRIDGVTVQVQQQHRMIVRRIRLRRLTEREPAAECPQSNDQQRLRSHDSVTRLQAPRDGCIGMPHRLSQQVGGEQ
jgi:hypothetical protein